MKIYRIIFSSVDIDEGDNTITITTFIDRKNAEAYLKEQIKTLKKQEKDLDMDYYCVDEDETSYERYLDGRAIEDSVSIWLQEDETYDEKFLQKEQELQDKEEKDYEIP